MLTLLICLAAAAVWRGLCVHACVQRSERVWRRAHGGAFAFELRRQVGLVRAEGDSQSFPRPRECRWLVWRLCGLAVHARAQAVALPDQAEARLAEVSVDETDAAFDPAFRARGGAAVARTTAFGV